MFCHFGQKFENSKWPPYVGRGKFFLNYQEYNAEILCGSKILPKSLYLARLPLLVKIRKFKMAAIFGEGKIWGKLQRLHSLDTLWVENFDEIALSRMVNK